MLYLAALILPPQRPEFWQLAIRRAAKRLLRAQCLPHEHLEKMLRRMT